MRQNANAEVFKGTVSELAGTMTGPNGEVLNVQDVQFLTRIGNGTFAKKVGTAPGTGTRGGKRAIIWEINPTARLVLGVASNETPNREKSRAKPEQSSSKSVEALVAEALAKHGITAAPAKRTRRTKAEMEAARAAEAKAAGKSKGRAKAAVEAPVKVSKSKAKAK